MDVREKLVELLYTPFLQYKIKELSDTGDIADYLISNGVTVQEWISVKDRLPEEKVNCIVRYQHAYCDNAGYWAIGMCFMMVRNFSLVWHIKLPTGCYLLNRRKENDYGKECSLQKM